jgi:hypothetical protein
MGSYAVFIQTSATLFNAEAFRSHRTPGVRFHDLPGVWIAGSGGDNSVINGVDGPVTSANPGTVEPVDLVSWRMARAADLSRQAGWPRPGRRLVPAG